MGARHRIKPASASCAAAMLTLALVSCGSDDTSSDSNDSGPTASQSSEENTPASDDNSDDAADKAGKTKSTKDTGEKPEPDKNADKPTAKPDRPRGKTYLVTEVVDGDTVHLDKPGETSVRIIGIETPETVHPSEPVECGGPAASKAAERLLSGKRVRLVYDPSQGRTDYYGRVLGYLDVPGIGDYGLRMINRGFAAEYTYDTAYRKQAQYRAAQQRAQNANRGVWGHCGGVDTPLEQPTEDPPTSEPPPDTDQGSGCAPGYSPCAR